MTTIAGRNQTMQAVSAHEESISLGFGGTILIGPVEMLVPLTDLNSIMLPVGDYNLMSPTDSGTLLNVLSILNAITTDHPDWGWRLTVSDLASLLSFIHLYQCEKLSLILWERSLNLPMDGSFIVSPSGFGSKRNIAVAVLIALSAARFRALHLRYWIEGDGIRIGRCHPRAAMFS